MTEEVKEISSITFGMLSAEDIRQMSAFQVTTAKISSTNLFDTVHDPRSGPIGSAPCETCRQTEWDCPGHFGHIELNVPIIHPLFLDHVVSLLKIFCWKCNEFILTKDHLELNNILRLEKKRRFDAVLEKVKKCDRCIHCSSIKAEYKLGINDITYKTIYRIFSKTKSKDSGNRTIVSAQEVKKIFENVKPEYVEMLGVSHPKDFCLTVFPVIPSCCRPHEVQDGNINDDDLTYQLIEIVKNNIMIGNVKKELSEAKSSSEISKLNDKYIKYTNNLKFRIETYCNNSQGKATHATTGRPIKALRERLAGKEGQIRKNLLGKRCEMSGRTVVGPDPTLRIDEAILPVEMAKSLSVPISVNKFNKSELTEIVNNGNALRLVKKDATGKEIKINLNAAINNRTVLQHDDVVERDNEKIIIKDPKNFILKEGDVLFRNNVIQPIDLSKKFIELEEKWIVHRNLKNGDVAILNRQPTLHKASMMAFKCKIAPVKTLKISLAAAKPFNADFDGDEMNIHVPQSEEARTETLLLSTPKQCLISSQAGKPNLTIVQDSLTGAFLMSKEKNDQVTLKTEQFNDILMVLDHIYDPQRDGLEYFLKRKEEISEKLKTLGFSGEVKNGRGLLSLLFPCDFFINEDDLKISHGIIHEGALTKKYLSSTETSLIKVLYKEYGTEVSASFINNIQFMTNKWLFIESFSIHAADCIKQKEVLGSVEQCLMESEKIKMTTKNPFIREHKIMQTLSNAKDIGMKIAKDALSNDNNFITTVESGSKGDFFNIAQITGLLGQQNIQGQRIKPLLNNGTRTLPHYPFAKKDNGSTNDLIEEYESQGFINSSFAQGLNPKEFFFHAMSGRQGVCDTAMSTATSGYIMRRTVKLTEDIQVKYDGTVQDTHGRRFQMAYGGLGYDPAKMVKVNGESEICNVERLAFRLNSNFETKN